MNWFLGEKSWTFGTGQDEAGVDTSDPINHAGGVRDLYLKANPSYDGRTTVPVLWDKQKQTIVSNESSEIIRMLNSEFNAFAKNPQLDLYPEALRSQIDEVNDFVYPTINNGVYRCGFATTQEACMSSNPLLLLETKAPFHTDEDAFESLFGALDKIEERLSKSRYFIIIIFQNPFFYYFQRLLMLLADTLLEIH